MRRFVGIFDVAPGVIGLQERMGAGPESSSAVIRELLELGAVAVYEVDVHFTLHRAKKWVLSGRSLAHHPRTLHAYAPTAALDQANRERLVEAAAAIAAGVRVRSSWTCPECKRNWLGTTDVCRSCRAPRPDPDPDERLFQLGELVGELLAQRRREAEPS